MKKWYIIKERGSKRGTAYRLSPSQIKKLRPEFEYRGPYNSFIQAVPGQADQTYSQSPTVAAPAPDLPSTPKRKTQMQPGLDEVSVVDMTDLTQ